MISFFQDGSHIIGADYGYTPATKEKETVIVGYEKAIEKDEETGEEKEVDKAITAERITPIPARGREDCIFVADIEVAPGYTPRLVQEEDGTYSVEIDPPPTQEEPESQDPESPESNS